MQILSVYQLICIYLLFLFISKGKNKLSKWLKLHTQTLIRLGYYLMMFASFKLYMSTLRWLYGLTQKQLKRIIGSLIVAAFAWVTYGVMA